MKKQGWSPSCVLCDRIKGPAIVVLFLGKLLLIGSLASSSSEGQFCSFSNSPLDEKMI